MNQFPKDKTTKTTQEQLDECVTKLNNIRDLARYEEINNDNSCSDSDCCDGPWPNLELTEVTNGRFVRWVHLNAILLGNPIPNDLEIKKIEDEEYLRLFSKP